MKKTDTVTLSDITDLLKEASKFGKGQKFKDILEKYNKKAGYKFGSESWGIAVQRAGKMGELSKLYSPDSPYEDLRPWDRIAALHYDILAAKNGEKEAIVRLAKRCEVQHDFASSFAFMKQIKNLTETDKVQMMIYSDLASAEIDLTGKICSSANSGIKVPTLYTNKLTEKLAYIKKLFKEKNILETALNQSRINHVLKKLPKNAKQKIGKYYLTINNGSQVCKFLGNAICLVGGFISFFGAVPVVVISNSLLKGVLWAGINFAITMAVYLLTYCLDGIVKRKTQKKILRKLKLDSFIDESDQYIAESEAGKRLNSIDEEIKIFFKKEKSIPEEYRNYDGITLLYDQAVFHGIETIPSAVRALDRKWDELKTPEWHTKFHSPSWFIDYHGENADWQKLAVRYWSDESKPYNEILALECILHYAFEVNPINVQSQSERYCPETFYQLGFAFSDKKYSGYSDEIATICHGIACTQFSAEAEIGNAYAMYCLYNMFSSRFLKDDSVAMYWGKMALKFKEPHMLVAAALDRYTFGLSARMALSYAEEGKKQGIPGADVAIESAELDIEEEYKQEERRNRIIVAKREEAMNNYRKRLDNMERTINMMEGNGSYTQFERSLMGQISNYEALDYSMFRDDLERKYSDKLN